MSKIEVGGIDHNGSKKLIVKESRKSLDSSPKNSKIKKQSFHDSKEPMMMVTQDKNYPYYKHLSPDTTQGKFKKIESIIDNKFREQIEKYKKEEKVRIQIDQLRHLNESTEEKLRSLSGLGKYNRVELNTMTNFGMNNSPGKPNQTG